MGKLNIAHHKSYHPYRRDNIERVRKDEEEAAAKEAREDGRIALADSEARIELLRERSGLTGGGKKFKGKGKEKELDLDDVISSGAANAGGLIGTGGHINFFEDLEHSSIAKSIKGKKQDPAETEKGVPLAPSAKDLRPWYTANKSLPESDAPEEGDKAWEEKKKRDRDLAFKSLNDPLTSIAHQLASRVHTSTPPKPQSHLLPRPPRGRPQTSRPSQPPKEREPAPPPPPPSTIESRLTRESSERERALALIARKKREMAGSETPSTVNGGDGYGGYGDVFNRKEVEEAHRGKRGWGRRDMGSDRDMRDRRWDGESRRRESGGW